MVEVSGSSSIRSFDWDEDNGLTVTFQSGRSYNYPDVPKTIFNTMEAIEEAGGGSVGSAFSTLVRKAGFSYYEVSE